MGQASVDRLTLPLLRSVWTQGNSLPLVYTTSHLHLTHLTASLRWLHKTSVPAHVAHGKTTTSTTRIPSLTINIHLTGALLLFLFPAWMEELSHSELFTYISLPDTLPLNELMQLLGFFFFIKV